MINVSILIHEDVILSSAAGPYDILTRTNQILEQHHRPALFQVSLVSEVHKNIHLNATTQFICNHTIADLARPDLIIVPAFANTWEVIREKNRALIGWIQTMHAAGSEIASLCVGCYFLAEAGLLEGKPCTSHWGAVDDLQRCFPQIKVQQDSVLTDQDGIYTGGGAFSSLNLVLYLVEKFCGHDIAVRVSKNFSIHADHINQAYFSVFQGQRKHTDKTILQAQELIEQHFEEDISVEQIAQQVNMSKRNFIRRFKLSTQNTPLEYIQRVRIEAAKKLLEQGNKNVYELMLAVGYKDDKTFRQIFKRIAGATPQAYRNKYARMLNSE